MPNPAFAGGSPPSPPPPSPSTLLPVTAAPVGAAGGSSFVSMANGHRNRQRPRPGRPPRADRPDRRRARPAARRGRGSSAMTSTTSWHRFDDRGICWRGFGEIVAYNGSGDFSAFGTQWMNSTTHRNIMLGDYTHAGGSREQVDGRWYGVMIFVKLCGASDLARRRRAASSTSGTSTFIDDIEWLVEQGITSGCAPSRFCPRDPVDARPDGDLPPARLRLPGHEHRLLQRRRSSTHEVAINRTRQAERHERLRRVALLPGQLGHARPDGQLPRPGARPAAGHRRPLQRRQRLDPRGRHQPPRRGGDRRRLRAAAASARIGP